MYYIHLRTRTRSTSRSSLLTDFGKFCLRYCTMSIDTRIDEQKTLEIFPFGLNDTRCIDYEQEVGSRLKRETCVTRLRPGGSSSDTETKVTWSLDWEKSKKSREMKKRSIQRHIGSYLFPNITIMKVSYMRRPCVI